MITGPICRAARAIVELSRQKLSAASGIDESVIEAFERKIATPPPGTVKRLQETLEEMGAVFIPEDTRGAGVRLKFTQSEARRIATLESEGGPIRSDDVP